MHILKTKYDTVLQYFKGRKNMIRHFLVPWHSARYALCMRTQAKTKVGD